MKSLSSAALIAALGTAGCCNPPPNPSLDDIIEWSHPSTVTGAACKSATDVEPNDSIEEANLPSQDGLASCGHLSINGSLGGDTDAFYVWGASCPKAPPSASLAGGLKDVRLCLFVSCSEGKTGLDDTQPCGDGSKAYRMDEGLLGCCSSDGSVSVAANCDEQYSPLGATPQFDAYVVVDRTGDATSCEAYSVDVSL